MELSRSVLLTDTPPALHTVTLTCRDCQFRDLIASQLVLVRAPHDRPVHSGKESRYA
jgi:hypothetical protein